MATTTQITTVRDNIAEPNDVNGWTDSRISAYIDALATDETEANLDLVSGRIWSVKASEFATLVNVSENGSSRSLGDLFKNAQARASFFNAQGETTIITVADRPRTRAITRP